MMINNFNFAKSIHKISSNFEEVNGKLSSLVNKVYTYRNENIALNKRIAFLEKENNLLREKRDKTVSKLNVIVQKFDEAGI